MAKNNWSWIALILIFLIWVPVSLANLSCRTTPTARVSLRDPGKPLHNYVVQDQDGLGTCYANALSVMIYAESGKEVSAHQIATMYGMAEQGVTVPTPSTAGPRVSAILNGESIEASGTLCGAYGVIKTRPYLCTRQQVPIESMSNDSHNIQNEYSTALGNLYDHSAGLRNLSPAERTRIGTELRGLRTQLMSRMTSANNDMFQQCHDSVQPILDGDISGTASDAFMDYMQEACLDQYNELASYAREKAIVDAQLANVRTPAAERPGLVTKQTELTASLARQRARVQAMGTVHYRMPDQGGDIATLPSDSTGTIPNRAKPRCVFNDNIKSTLRKQYYKNVHKQFNTKGFTEAQGLLYPFDDGGTRRSEGRMTPVIQSFLQGVGSISGDSSWPQALFAQNGNMMSENQLQAILYQDVDMMIPSECAASGLMGEGISDAMVTTQLRSRGICLPAETNSALNKLLRSLGLGPQREFPNNGQIDQILTNIDRPYDEFLMGVIGPGCMNDTSGRVQASSYNNLSCERDNIDRLSSTVKEDYWRSLNDEKKIELILEMLALADPAFDLVAGRAEIIRDRAKWLSNTVAGHPILGAIGKNRAIDSVFVRRITSTPSGRAVRETRVKTRLNSAVQAKLASNHPVAVSLCAGVLYDNSFDSQFATRKCSGKGLPGDSGRHSVVIIGQRCNARGEIEYQIQNSWGNSCTNPNNECVPAEGTMWLPESALARNIDEIQTLTPP
ncbi:MAG: hypothetical protein A2X86_03130 [Bdellovibrionales bacterium GWA2_49_15]|nr:MAG: hypothetical protein A2X86_03130 [Bdellovibrionales bacterium GWA2_49_15]HAZ12207.1 hypothetical protein [Bdellovibrionales bacterium]